MRKDNMEIQIFKITLPDRNENFPMKKVEEKHENDNCGFEDSIAA